MSGHDSKDHQIASDLVVNMILPAGDRYLEQSFKSEKDLKYFRKTATRFFRHSINQCKFISTLAFPDERKNLEDLYVPLNIVSTDALSPTDGSESERLLITSETHIFQNNSRLLINDNAGMGKSTLSKRVALNVFNNTAEIPVFMELRSVDSRPLELQICELLGLDLERLAQGISPLPFVYILDGLDEVPFDIRGQVAKSISEFARDLPEAKVLVTSRKEIHLANLSEFYVMSIDKLKEDEAFEIIKRYDPSGELADSLIKTIKTENSSDLKEFLSTPLYVSLLFFSYRYKANVPHKKHIFYGQVFDALFERHDLNKDTSYVRPKYSKLDSAQFEQVLRRLAVFCLSHRGKLSFDRNELEREVSELIGKMRGISCNPVSYVKDLTSTVPLFVEDGTQIKWTHKSLMEYFAAKFICNDTNGEQKKTLLSLHNGDEWSNYYNLFDLCFDIDFSSFRASILKQVLCEFMQHCDAGVFASRNTRIRDVDVDYRCAVTFYGPHVLTFLEEMDIDVGNVPKKTSSKIAQLAKDIAQKKPSSINFFHISGDIFNLKYSSGSPLEKASKGSWFIASGSNRNGQILKLLKFRCPELFLHDEYLPLTSNLTKDVVDTDANNVFLVDENAHELLDRPANYGYITGLLVHSRRNYCLSKKAVEEELREIELDDSDGVNDLLDLLN